MATHHHVTPFQFEDHSVRVVLGDDGEPLFVGKDICEALGYADPTNAMKQHCKGVVKRHPLQTPGGMQEMRVLTEPDMLRLIINSQLESAQRFERLVFEEILPSIRKTGSYTHPQLGTVARTSTNPLPHVKAHMTVAAAMEKLGVRKEMAMAVALKAIHDDTGMTTEGYRLALPSVEDVATLNQTQLGELIGVSSRVMGKLLRDAGLMEVDESGTRIPTEKGRKFGEVKPYKAFNGHAGYEIRWNKGVLDFLAQMEADHE